MRDADAVQRLVPLGIEPVAESPKRFVRCIAADVAQNAALLRAANYTPE